MRIEWIIPQEHGPGRTAVVLILQKQHTLVHNCLRPYKNGKIKQKMEDPELSVVPWSI